MTTEEAKERGWIYEDALPELMPVEQYNDWYKESEIVDGVRMGPPLPISVKADLELTGLTAEEIKKMESTDHLVINEKDFISKKYAVDLCTRFAEQKLDEQRGELEKLREVVTESMKTVDELNAMRKKYETHMEAQNSEIKALMGLVETLDTWSFNAKADTYPTEEVYKILKKNKP